MRILLLLRLTQITLNQAALMEKRISKSNFKTHALEYFREVEQTGQPLIITDHGRPVLKIEPYAEDSQWADLCLFHQHLPPPLHPDPADRIIIATALQLGATLITKDQKIRDYPHVTTVW